MLGNDYTHGTALSSEWNQKFAHCTSDMKNSYTAGPSDDPFTCGKVCHFQERPPGTTAAHKSIVSIYAGWNLRAFPQQRGDCTIVQIMKGCHYSICAVVLEYDSQVFLGSCSRFQIMGSYDSRIGISCSERMKINKSK